jgi:hypothetical protein
MGEVCKSRRTYQHMKFMKYVELVPSCKSKCFAAWKERYKVTGLNTTRSLTHIGISLLRD